MDIKGLDYNTQREALLMPEYGREIQRMVAVAASLPTKEERNRCARYIVKKMEYKNPQVREGENYMQTLWDHLYLISNKQLDIDWPCDVSLAEKIQAKPTPLPLPHHDSPAPVRHYGRLVGQLFERLKTMPEGKERNALVRQTANQMKRDLLTWGHGSAENERVASDLARFTDGKIQIDISRFRFDRVTPAQGSLNEGGSRRRKRK